MSTSLALSIAAAFAGGTPLVVDSAGSGDYTTVQAAIDAAAPGDVVLILPGLYAPFELDKRLSLIGVESGLQPRIDGLSEITALGEVTLSNLHIEAVRAIGVKGRLTIDRCSLQTVDEFSWSPFALRLDGCDQVEVVDSRLKGGVGGWIQTGGALWVDDSTVWLTGCEVIGHSWSGPQPVSPCYQEAGISALWAFRSVVRSQRSTFVGGNGAVTGGECGQLGHFSGPGGHGVYAKRSDIRIRNLPVDVIQGGHGPSQGTASIPGLSVKAELDSAVWISSATLTGTAASTDTTSVLILTSDQPLLERTGSGEPGATFVLHVRAPVGALGLLAIGAPATPFVLAGWDAPLALGLPLLAVVPLAAQGLTVAVDVPLTVPPTLGVEAAGFLLRAQVVFPGLPAWGDASVSATSDPVALVIGA